MYSYDAGIINNSLPSWREIITPHPDVSKGQYKKVDFAASLSQASRGEGSNEYTDPIEFFRRTYITEGMKSLMVQCLKRLGGHDGEPVIQLKIAFGGGKTHSMLALYHLIRGHIKLENIPELKAVFDDAEIFSIPSANVAVLDCTAMNPAEPRIPAEFPGMKINTLWGEMAYQLARSAGDMNLFNYVSEADKMSISPGSDAIKNLFNSCGSCLVLLDELVAYGRKLAGVKGLPAGTFGNFLTFVQELTEAARASRNSLIVASIPESDLETGGEAGRKVLEVIEHTFGRMEAIWKPVAANEGFEIVRRRLFLDCKSPEMRAYVADSFSRIYKENASDFPVEACEAAYREKIISCYPFHPEIFDRLYEDWGTLDNFQRTRDVLRFMAVLVNKLWMNQDKSALIMPGSVDFSIYDVRYELIRHLSEGWQSIIDSEVDGESSMPYRKDNEIQRFGIKLAARRVARTIMLGSAPTNRSQFVRGIEAERIRLGVVQPGENIADFNDALVMLQKTLAYLYTDEAGKRYWYDTRPTLKKTVEDRAAQITEYDLEKEIKDRLKRFRKEKPFSGIHVCPSTSLDVPDEKSMRLVIFGPEKAYNSSENDVKDSCSDIFYNRGNSPRSYRNMLAFLAPDSVQVSELKKDVRIYLAWKSIENDGEKLNLDSSQLKEAKDNTVRCNSIVDMNIQQAWCWLLVPYIDNEENIKNIIWDIKKIGSGKDNFILRAAAIMASDEMLIEKFAPVLLLMTLDNILWKDDNDISIKTLWDNICRYCYLPRLASYDVLEDAIKEGLKDTKYFAFAEGKSGDKYIGIKYNCSVNEINISGYLIKKDVAIKQLEAETEKASEGNFSVQSSEEQEARKISGYAKDNKSSHFFLSADMNSEDMGKKINDLYAEVITHLNSVANVKMNISLEINMTAPDGIPDSVVRTVSENCNTLKINNFGFTD